MVTIEGPLTWREVARVAEGEGLELSGAALQRLAEARAIVQAIVARGMRAYGVSTGVGALHDVMLDPGQQRQLSRNLLFSHACGVGPALDEAGARAVVCTAVNNWCHGHSGLRPVLVETLAALLNENLVPHMPRRGSVGYLTHMAHAALVLIGHGHVTSGHERLTGAEALRWLGLGAFDLEAKEGLSLVNGSPCATGLGALALADASRLADWADAIAASSFEALRGKPVMFDDRALRLKPLPGLLAVGARMRRLLAQSELLDREGALRTQDALSLRAIPQVHGAVRDTLAVVGDCVDRELASVTDNPAVAGSPDRPEVYSQAHPVAESLALALDGLGIGVAELGAISERRLDRLLNPALSGLPAFLAPESGLQSGLMIAQYTAVSLVADNRRLALPASVETGVTSALQEDHLAFATPAALKAREIVENAETILAIECLAAAQADDFHAAGARRGEGTAWLRARVRERLPPYRDDRPLADDIASVRDMLRDRALHAELLRYVEEEPA